MSSFGSASYSPWPKYATVSLTRCPDCPRLEPLKRKTCKTNENGNRGREFVACESRPYREGEKILKTCWHFECIDEYIDRLGLLESIGTTRELNLGGPLAVENEADTRAVPMMRNAELVEVKGS